jgi:hypothetical protein
MIYITVCRLRQGAWVLSSCDLLLDFSPVCYVKDDRRIVFRQAYPGSNEHAFSMWPIHETSQSTTCSSNDIDWICIDVEQLTRDAYSAWLEALQYAVFVLTDACLSSTKRRFSSFVTMTLTINVQIGWTDLGLVLAAVKLVGQILLSFDVSTLTLPVVFRFQYSGTLCYSCRRSIGAT